MNRRSFLSRLGAAAIGLTLSAKLPGIAGAAPRLANPETPPAVTTWLRSGDVFTIAGVCDLNPVTGLSTGRPKLFVAVADTSSSPGGVPINTFCPAMVEHGPYANVAIDPSGPGHIEPLLTGETQPLEVEWH